MHLKQREARIKSLCWKALSSLSANSSQDFRSQNSNVFSFTNLTNLIKAHHPGSLCVCPWVWDSTVSIGCSTVSVCWTAYCFPTRKSISTKMDYFKSEGGKTFPTHVSFNPYLWKWQLLVISEGLFESGKVLQTCNGLIPILSAVVLVQHKPLRACASACLLCILYADKRKHSD